MSWVRVRCPIKTGLHQSRKSWYPVITASSYKVAVLIMSHINQVTRQYTNATQNKSWRGSAISDCSFSCWNCRRGKKENKSYHQHLYNRKCHKGNLIVLFIWSIINYLSLLWTISFPGPGKPAPRAKSNERKVVSSIDSLTPITVSHLDLVIPSFFFII